ncbi:MAG TPA: RNA polymerase sigma factor [Methylomirabilota bacterium]|jgi:RNA polymerase sigma-70 factor (ECF subfamily)|nr:RNA polymerase sigma factor [Methylomirabilota bacterium]
MAIPNADEQDRSAMQRLANGEDSALEELMSRHSERLFHYLLRVLQNETRAADLAEEAFVKVYQNRLRFKPVYRFATWLYTIATNLARDFQRYQTRHPQLSLDGKPEGGVADFRETLAESGPNPGETLESLERAEAVRRAVGGLSEELRIPLVLSVYEEKSHAEIAEILQCSPKAVEMRIYRARAELRIRLERVLV